MSKLEPRDRSETKLDDDVREKPLDRVNDKLPQLNYGREYREMLQHPRMVERYLKGEISFHVHVGIELLSKVDTEYFCAVFARPDALSGDRWGHPDDLNIAFGVDLQSVRVVNDRNNGQQQAVFVGYVEIMQNIERGVLGRIACPIGLQLLDSCGSGHGYSLYLSAATGALEARGRSTDWKLQDVGLSSARPNRIQLRDDMIERGSQLVDNFSDDDCDAEWDGSVAECGKAILPRLRIEVTSDAIVVTKKAGDFRIQVSDVLIGPMDLCGNTI